MATTTSRSAHGEQFCRGALERGQPTHRCVTYTTVYYRDGRRFHFCDEHPHNDEPLVDALAEFEYQEFHSYEREIGR